MSKLILLVGNVGSGKSTYAKKIVKENPNCFVVSRDSLRYMVNAGEYTFDREKETIVHDLAMRCLASLLASGLDVILDETNMNKRSRKNYIDFAKEYEGYEIEAHVMPRLGKEESVKRRLQDPHGTYDKAKWEEVFDMFSKRYIVPSESEGFDNVLFL